MSIFKILILAQTFYTIPDPDIPNAYLTSQLTPVVAEPSFPIGVDTRMLDAARVSNPEMLQPYVYPGDDNYPLRSQVGRNFVPIEEQMAQQAYTLDQARERAALSGAQLQQQITRQNFEYDTSVNNQAGAAMQELGTLNPASPDFPMQVIDLQKRYPLAAQNQGFQQSLNRINGVYNQSVDRDEAITRMQYGATLQRQNEQIRSADEYRERAALGGPRAFQTYQQVMRESGDPAAAYSAAVPLAEQDRMERERQEITARYQAQNLAQQDRPISNSEYLRAIDNRETMIQRKLQNDPNYNPANDPTVQLLDDTISAYRRDRNIPVTAPSSTPAPAAQQTGASAAKSWFQSRQSSGNTGP